MCTLHLWFQVFPDAPVVFAANRDENLGRPWHPPALLLEHPRVFGPRDGAAGGTWLGVNEGGVLVSLANHLGTLATGASLCSRGAYVLDALRQTRAEEAARFAREGRPACKAFTLLVADPEAAFVIDHSPADIRVYRLEPGCHVVTNDRFQDPADAKARRSLDRMAELAAATSPPEPGDLFRFLADHQQVPGAGTPLCVHPAPGDTFGTSSASVVRIGPDRAVDGFWFAPGPPCTARWAEAPLP